jgi:hypothetical protein
MSPAAPSRVSIWRHIDGRRSLRDLVTYLVGLYDIDAATAEEAVSDTIEPLLEAGLLTLGEPR